MKHGILQLVRCKDASYPRPKFDHEICRIGPNYTDEEKEAFDYLWRWLMFGRGLFISTCWSPGIVKVRKQLSSLQKYERACTKWRNKLRKKFPLFWEEIFEDKKVDLIRRYNIDIFKNHI